MTRGEDFVKNRICIINKLCSVMSNSAWCDLKTKGDISKLHDKCPNPKGICQNVITFTPHRYMLEGGSRKSKLQKIFKGTQTAWNNFLKPVSKMATPLITAAIAAKNESPQSAQTTSNILKPITGGKNLSLIDMHGHELRLKVM